MKKARRSWWVVLVILAVCLLIYPINTFAVRLGLLFCISGAWLGALWVFRKIRPVAYGLIIAALLVCGFLLCPGRASDPRTLREAYLASLRSYEGVHYLWGGENDLGIDCSGLVRASLIKANFKQGLLTLNPRLVRFSISLWWHDCSAKALGEEYRGQTKHISSVRGINAMDETSIQPGDIAVTATGVHVLAYLGDNRWIEADPHAGKVIIVAIPAMNNPWFQEPVNIMRWTELE